MLMPTLDGNNSDKVSFRERVEPFAQQMREGFGVKYLVADSAWYTTENLQSMDSRWWISRVPETLKPAPVVINESAPKWLLNPTQSAFHSREVEYGGIKPRWVVVFSPKAYQRASKTLNKQWLKQSRAELNAFNTLGKPPFACEADARNALTQFEKTLKCNVLSETTIQAIPRFKGQGRPAKERQPDDFEYHIDGAMASHLPERSRRLQRQSGFILASHQLNTEKLSEVDRIAAYKNAGFVFLKTPCSWRPRFISNRPNALKL